MKVTIVGTGYVGLVTGACLAEMGNHVLKAALRTPLVLDGRNLYEAAVMAACGQAAGVLDSWCQY